MNSKLWAQGGSSSDSGSDSDSSSSSEGPAQVAAPTVKRGQRWAEAESSEDEEETRRVVRSHADKRNAVLADKIKAMKNHMKNEDFGSVLTDYEGILKTLEQLMRNASGEALPSNFVKAVSQLETFIEGCHTRHQEAKANKGERLTESKAKAFNTLRAKVRKGNTPYRADVDKFKEDPSAFESEQEESEQQESSSSDSDAGASSSSSSDSDSSSSSGSDSDSDSDSDSSSSSGSSTYSSGSTGSRDGVDADEIREKRMLRFLITPEVAEKKKNKEQAQKDAIQKLSGKVKTSKVKGGGMAAVVQQEEPDEYKPEKLQEKVTEIARSRGRRGFDRKTYIESLARLLIHAEKIGPRSMLYIYSNMVSSDFDNTGTVHSPMSMGLWNAALDKVGKMLPLLVQSWNELRETMTLKEIQKQGEDEEKRDPTAHISLQDLFVAVVAKLDDELYKALQFTVDVYGTEYQEVLANSSKFLVLLKRVFHFLEDSKQVQPLGTVALRLMEQIYYKPDVLNKAVYESIQHTVPDSEKAKWMWPEDSCALMSQLCRHVHAAGEVRGQRRALLVQAYHLALHDHFQEARDLIHLTNMELRSQESYVDVQILYNRVLAQMGLCAFRLGKVQEAHSCLMDVCIHGKNRELLAQGLSYAKFQEKTAEQERDERLRQLPYHMHINLEVLDSAHHMCAMLLEVPNLALQAIDPTSKRGIISKVLRKALENHDKQVFTGPPENAKEAVVCAAKALQRGDWQGACAAVDTLKLWDHIDVGSAENGQKVKNMIKEKMKTEALRTYLFSYASIYDAFHLEQLVSMFDLPAKQVHSIVSKMMIKEEITAFWDESSKYLLMQHTEPTPLQRLALTLADRAAQAVENNERLVEHKTGGHGFKDQAGKGGRFEVMMDGKGRRFGKGMDKGKGKGRGKGGGFSRAPTRGGWEKARVALTGQQQQGWSRPTGN